MASVTLNAVWIGLASDLSAQISAGSMGSMGDSSSSGAATALARSDTITNQGTVQQFANGVLRSIATVGTANVYQCTLRALTWAQKETLKSWFTPEPQLCLLRDRVGRRIWGVFSAIAVGDYMGQSQLHDVSLTFSEVTWTDQV